MTAFTKADAVNPILMPTRESTFYCPIRQEEVHWEVKDVFNPAVVVRDGKIHMLYRAEDSVGRYNGTSRIGLAISEDGLHFAKQPEPVFFPDEDFMKIYEWEGGIEDPRVVETDDGRYIMTYTAYDGQTARLCVASSPDLQNWEKHGMAFGDAEDGRYTDLWSKSGAIVCRKEGEKLIAQKIGDKYWMYWGDKHLHIATSEDLLDWEPLTQGDSLMQVMSFRAGYFDSDLVEPGPPAIITDDGILLIYNGRNYGPEMNPDIEEGTYSAGQVLLSPEDPTEVLARTEQDFFRPEKDYEIFGQVNKVVFLQGLVPYSAQWYLYYGTADSKIAVATSPMD
jgi:predicted GH43/DUF377 family glycosyl hydrolase